MAEPAPHDKHPVSGGFHITNSLQILQTENVIQLYSLECGSLHGGGSLKSAPGGDGFGIPGFHTTCQILFE